LEHLAEGSTRQALQLTATDGLELYREIMDIFSRLPAMDWTAAHALADSLAAGSQEQRFKAFFDLLLSELAAIVRARATGQGSASSMSLAERLIPDARLANWAALWEAIVREKADADELNLDRKALIMRTLARLETA
jgi:DNA polymerase-3 subunit delta'